MALQINFWLRYVALKAEQPHQYIVPLRIFATLPIEKTKTHSRKSAIMRYDYARDNLESSPVNTLNWDAD
jgi:hypothetical protein